jgi:hypothetical protein
MACPLFWTVKKNIRKIYLGKPLSKKAIFPRDRRQPRPMMFEA